MSWRLRDGQVDDAEASRRGSIKVFLTPLLLLVWLGFLAGFRALTLPEEARYVSVAAAMARSGDWLTPRLNGLPFLDKPPLFYWLDAASLSIFGSIQWASRLAPLAGTPLGALAIWRLVRRRTGAPRGGWMLLALATSPLFFAGSQLANTDMLMAGCIAATICLAAESVLRAQEDATSGPIVMSTWVAAALGVLAKGLIGLFLPAAVLLAWAFTTSRVRHLRVLAWPPAPLVFVLLAIPWFVAQEVVHPGLARHFFLHHHVDRFAGTGFNSVRGWWFYLAVIPASAIPWSLWLLRALRPRPAPEVSSLAALRSLMWVWLATVTIFFSIPQSKPVGYIMPVLFPIAFLAADAICSGQDRPRLLAKASLVLAATASLGYVLLAGVTYEGDNRLLGRTLAALRKIDEPVLFVAQYYYDVPIYAPLQQPARVLGEWSDPQFAKEDDWRRELVEAAVFAPDTAPAVLVDRRAGFAMPCGSMLWVVAPSGAERQVHELATAVRILESNGAVLWRLGPRECATP